MKIKPENNTSAKKKRTAAAAKGISHWWLLPDKPRGVSRLSSRNKVNHKRRVRVGKSEFVQMAEQTEGGKE